MGWSGMADGPHPGMTLFRASQTKTWTVRSKTILFLSKFYYPNEWESFADSSGPKAVNYVRVRNVVGEVPLNEMAVGYFTGKF